MEGGSDVVVEDPRLPTRLLKTDHFPNRRLNCYSKADTIAFVKYTLRDRPELFQRIRNSRFGKLWDFPALSEFASVIGLHCGEFPEDYDPDWYLPVSKGPDRWWREYIGNDSRTTIADISVTLKTETDMDDDRKLRLCLILRVDGVLCVSSQVHKPTPKYVSMLSDIDAFLEFPWGRESFLKTIATMRPNKQMAVKDEDPVRTLVKNLGQPSFRLLGFPLAFQLLAFEAIPSLLRYLPTTSDDDILLNLPDENFPDNPSLTHLDVVNAENHPEPFIPVDPPAGYIGWGEWAEQEVYVPPRVAHKKHIRNRKKRPLKAKASGSGTRKSARGKEKVKILKEQQAAERTTRLERTRLIQKSALYRKVSTQRRTRRNQTQRRPDPSRAGSEKIPSDSIISLKDGERPAEDWMDTGYDGKTEVGSSNEQACLFIGAGDAMQQSQFSPSLNQHGGLRGEASTSRGQLFGQSTALEKEEQAKAGEEKRVKRGDGEMVVHEQPNKEK
ncbi:unnamed protein product [Microthlaspi erraticum]|uniref:DUF1985 domain-containing protein n=1 Tax=Microthlaspi erraticum TaxID=1685480 RepID=A0A6D2KI73_9BRAS|nr:unnamed protein product [Microthlaspi erraticum]